MTDNTPEDTPMIASDGPRPSSSPTLTAFYDRFVHGTLPIFAGQGWDAERGGLVERLTPELAPDSTPFRRSMVHGRQLYVYSVWSDRLGNRSYADHADRIYQYLVDRFADPDRGGWFEKTDLDGRVVSSDKVLYSHAFVLLGLAAYRHCLGRGAEEHVSRTLDYIESRFRYGDGLYHAALDRTGRAISGSVDQNPLMHLLEALLFLSEQAGRPDALGIADRIVARAQRSFLRDGLILEHLGHDLEPDPAKGHVAEPGHQAEWAWLLNWYGRLGRRGDLDELSRTLAGNGMRHGWDHAHGGLFDQIDRTTGQATSSTKRLWPLGESIKAAAVFPACVAAYGQSVDSLADLLCRRYLHPEGTWAERLHRDLSVADPSLPASTCYHLSFALTEALKTTPVQP